MFWLILLLCALAWVVLVVVYACCRMSGMSDEEVDLYAQEAALQADYEYLLRRRSEITQKTN